MHRRQAIRDTYVPAELGSAKGTLADYAEGSRVALSVGVDLELTAFLGRHDESEV